MYITCCMRATWGCRTKSFLTPDSSVSERGKYMAVMAWGVISRRHRTSNQGVTYPLGATAPRQHHAAAVPTYFQPKAAHISSLLPPVFPFPAGHPTTSPMRQHWAPARGAQHPAWGTAHSSVEAAQLSASTPCRTSPNWVALVTLGTACCQTTFKPVGS